MAAISSSEISLTPPESPRDHKNGAMNALYQGSAVGELAEQMSHLRPDINQFEIGIDTESYSGPGAIHLPVEVGDDWYYYAVPDPTRPHYIRIKMYRKHAKYAKKSETRGPRGNNYLVKTIPEELRCTAYCVGTKPCTTKGCWCPTPPVLPLQNSVEVPSADSGVKTKLQGQGCYAAGVKPMVAAAIKKRARRPPHCKTCGIRMKGNDHRNCGIDENNTYPQHYDF